MGDRAAHPWLTLLEQATVTSFTLSGNLEHRNAYHPYNNAMSDPLNFPEYPRSSHYDLHWMMENSMGPNAVWLAEGLAQVMDLKSGMRTLDMGCGKALSSIFLAKEFGMHVWANDLWIDATENWKRVCEAGLEDRVFPLHADAHALPYADAFFDAILSLDAYHYFGTDDLFLGSSFARLVKPGGQIGIIVPGLVKDFEDGLPSHLAPYWKDDFYSFHTPSWWRKHWEHSGAVIIDRVDLLPRGWEHWMRWAYALAEAGNPREVGEGDMLCADAGQYLGFVRVVAHRKP